jgi:hypothetical protein
VSKILLFVVWTNLIGNLIANLGNVIIITVMILQAANVDLSGLPTNFVKIVGAAALILHQIVMVASCILVLSVVLKINKVMKNSQDFAHKTAMYI